MSYVGAAGQICHVTPARSATIFKRSGINVNCKQRGQAVNPTRLGKVLMPLRDLLCNREDIATATVATSATRDLGKIGL